MSPHSTVALDATASVVRAINDGLTILEQISAVISLYARVSQSRRTKLDSCSLSAFEVTNRAE